MVDVSEYGAKTAVAETMKVAFKSAKRLEHWPVAKERARLRWLERRRGRMLVTRSGLNWYQTFVLPNQFVENVLGKVFQSDMGRELRNSFDNFPSVNE